MCAVLGFALLHLPDLNIPFKTNSARPSGLSIPSLHFSDCTGDLSVTLKASPITEILGVFLLACLFLHFSLFCYLCVCVCVFFFCCFFFFGGGGRGCSVNRKLHTIAYDIKKQKDYKTANVRFFFIHICWQQFNK